MRAQTELMNLKKGVDKNVTNQFFNLGGGFFSMAGAIESVSVRQACFLVGEYCWIFKPHFIGNYSPDFLGNNLFFLETIFNWETLTLMECEKPQGSKPG